MSDAKEIFEIKDLGVSHGGTVELAGFSLTLHAGETVILLGEADAYLHRGPMKEWDSAAPVVVAAAAGLHTSGLDGSALEYNKSDRFTHHLLICHPSLTDSLVEAASHTA